MSKASTEKFPMPEPDILAQVWQAILTDARETFTLNRARYFSPGEKRIRDIVAGEAEPTAIERTIVLNALGIANAIDPDPDADYADAIEHCRDLLSEPFRLRLVQLLDEGKRPTILEREVLTGIALDALERMEP